MPPDAFVLDDEVSGKRSDIEGAQNASILITILRPHHLVLRRELAPYVVVAIRADVDQNERRIFRLLSVQVPQVRNRRHTWATPRAPEIEQYDSAPKVFERNVLASE